jgi:phage repressor protein C with HTH and peptisase S24 domain
LIAHVPHGKALLDKPSSIAQLARAAQGPTIKPCFMDPNIELAIRLKKALQASKKTAADVAREMDESPQAVHGWLKTGRIRKTKLAGFARVTGSDIAYLISGGDTNTATVAESNAKYPAYENARDVPIIGFAIATPDEDGYFNDMGFPPGAGEAFLPWPTKDPNAYVLRVRGDSMQPRIRPGEMIVVEPGTTVHPGDDVVVKTTSGRKMVKQLLLRRASEVTLGSINQAHKQTTISIEEVESIHFVAGIVPRNAYVKEPGEK